MDNTDVQEKEEVKEEAVTYDEVVKLAMKLSPVERLKPIERVARTLRSDVRTGPPEPSRSLLGALAHLGEGPSAEEIDQNRREMLAGITKRAINTESHRRYSRDNLKKDLRKCCKLLKNIIRQKNI